MTQSQPSRSPGLDVADVLDQLHVGGDHRLPVAALEEPEVAADDGVALLLQDVDQVRPDVAAMAGYKCFHLPTFWFWYECVRATIRGQTGRRCRQRSGNGLRRSSPPARCGLAKPRPTAGGDFDRGKWAVGLLSTIASWVT